jgi:hypothetical protein
MGPAERVAVTMTMNLPEKPVIKSQSNTAQRYQRMLDHLAESASADDWNAVRAVRIKESDNYAKRRRWKRSICGRACKAFSVPAWSRTATKSRKGQVVFTIEKEPFETAVEQRKAQLAAAQATLANADQQLQRTAELVKRARGRRTSAGHPSRCRPPSVASAETRRRGSAEVPAIAVAAPIRDRDHGGQCAFPPVRRHDLVAIPHSAGEHELTDLQEITRQQA